MAGADVQEIHCKTLLNKIDVPRFPFRWTLNPYRGCRHACRYCYARSTHEFWGMNAGSDFDQRVFAKVNAPEVLRQELAVEGIGVRPDIEVGLDLRQRLKGEDPQLAKAIELLMGA